MRAREFGATHQLPVELRDGVVSAPQLLSELLHLLQKSLHLHAHIPGTGRNVGNVAEIAGSACRQVERGGGAHLRAAAVGRVAGVRAESVGGQSVLVHVVLLNSPHTTLERTEKLMYRHPTRYSAQRRGDRFMQIATRCTEATVGIILE